MSLIDVRLQTVIDDQAQAQLDTVLSSVTALIDTQALHHNLQQVRRLTPASRCMAMIKADAYGHGLLRVAQALSDADGFGVARLSEALQLRVAGILKPIVVFSGWVGPAELALMAQHNLALLVHTREQLLALEQTPLTAPLTVWLKVDTGLHRLGFDGQQAVLAYQRLCQCGHVRQPIGWLSHFSHADEPTIDETALQLARFEAAVSGKPGLRSVAGSGGIIQWPQSHYDWVRPGIMLYGISPIPTMISAEALGLQPVMTFKSHLVAVRQHPAQAPVGYGALWHSSRATRLGVVAMGYGDGYPRDAPCGTPLLVNGRCVPLVGRVSMDLLTVDLGPEAADRVGDAVIAWGQGLPAEGVAQYMGVSAYELVTRLTPRVLKVYRAG